MIPAKKSDGPVQVGGMLGEGVRAEGTLEFTQTFRVDGEFKGTILRSDRLVVGEKGKVSGELDVNALVVFGVVEGTLRVKGSLEIHPKGRIQGEVHLASPALTVLEGGVLEGTVTMDKGAAGDVAALPAKQAAR